ncbi:hypothetical protein BY996DRAFT_6421815 [Phakopsora pachyrhizi]|nr:hypothetical protein BY996DRAFT_6421815 [Phakopsora pachyrhizi]
MQYFSVQDEVAEVMNFARQLAARICGSVRGQSKSLRTKSGAQNSAQFQDQSAKNQSTPAVKSNFEQNLDVQAHIAASNYCFKDWEEINDVHEMGMAEKDGNEKSIRNEQLKTPEASSKLRLPFGPQDFMN